LSFWLAGHQVFVDSGVWRGRLFSLVRRETWVSNLLFPQDTTCFQVPGEPGPKGSGVLEAPLFWSAFRPFSCPVSPFSHFLLSLWHRTPNADPSPLSSPPQLSLRCTRGRGWTWGRRDAEAVAGSGRWSLPASPQPARGPAQVRGGALARPHPRGRRSRDSGLILSR